ncbi:ABC transporter ATP-binding protein [Thermus scotoductus]|uniref:Iron ABC transporter ATP-binding protein n=1 Tax=Thermus scotoductus TaxID=37636 RepID=A0A430R668_THESC|nr:ABC transporter ATP-binding protein [Thermus scotoductus]RTG93551.1 iron ABC transporter ATP-binding protein [Thermus scotoductus]RTH02915.1 iron ABC transporter ATP-binding protein [Thermus scotoductus]RTH22497.1 iron ABC transporter ATP-binding protein [Thermus scotoductus]RTI02109.1 iron ABC transporter ATP-binding protein [Thermus scotoductus]RTI24469.1 iron ABC transporter ATP-binding protein [Thermus scotoductus]
MERAPLLTLVGIAKHFGEHEVLKGIDLEVYPGEILALLGPSGCGKTTLLRVVAGLESPDRGRIFLEGREITLLPPERRGIGFVFQDYALFPHLTALGNVAFGLKGKDRLERAKRALERVGMTLFQDRRPGELSGGQQQRIALARALAPGPKLVLLDEPFSSLDASLKASTREEVRKILKETGTTALLVTHDQEEALSFADRLGVMRGGRLEQVGTPEEVYLRPKTPFVAQFLGRTNLLSGEGFGRHAQTCLGPVPLAEPAHGPLLLSLRPEALRLLPPETPEGALGQVLAREFKGHDLTYRVRLLSPEKEILVQEGPESPFREGDRVRLKVVGKGVALEGHPSKAPVGAD